MGINGLDLQVELVNCQEHGVGHNQHVIVSTHIILLLNSIIYLQLLQKLVTTYIIKGMDVSP